VITDERRITAHTLNSPTPELRLFYNFHAARISVTVSNGSSVNLCYPLPRESLFTEPLPSKWTSASRFQAVFTEALSSNESESYVTTDSQSANLSWNEAPIWGLCPDIY
jgi:hypothetical protein